MVVLVSGGASPHVFQFTFNQAEAVQSADVLVWMGPELTPWLEEALDTLALGAVQLTLLDTTSWASLELRGWDDWHDHGHGGHDDHEGHDDHGDDHDDHAKDAHNIDPHAWLDPTVAIAWVNDIAAALSDADPENADLYAANAASAIADLRQLDQDIAAQLADVARAPYLVPHDAYQYFETRYDLPAAGAISLSDASTPSPAKIAELQELVQSQNVSCVLSPPQSRSEWVELVREQSDARTALADPIGTTIDLGADHYAQTLRAIAQSYADCLGG